MAELNQEINRVANAMKYAMKMEMEGYDFYMDNAEKFSNPTTKEIFIDLANEELAHYNFLEQEMNNYVENPNAYEMSKEALDPENSIFNQRAEAQNLDTTLEQSDVPDMTILRTAYLVEADFAEYYESQAEQAEDEKIKGVFSMLSEWERGHEKMFRDEYNRLLKEYMSMPWGG